MTYDFELEAEGNVRILSRAPREPWADLADVLADSPPWVEAWSAGESARWLHERGVRGTDRRGRDD